MAKGLNKELFRKAKKYLVGGVNSPVRSFKAVGGYPLFVKKAKGAKIYDEENKEFIDYCMGWGSLILGHAHPLVIKEIKKRVEDGTSFGLTTKLEIELAKLIIEAMPSIEQVRFTNSGTEAVMGAIRLARAYTKKDKLIKFEGSYHGHADYLLVKGGSGQTTFGIVSSAGIARDFIKHTLVLPYNDIEKVKETARKYQKCLAAIIVEPVLANCGVILPKEGFLQDLRKIADKYNILLIFDEVVTGFRLSYSGAQGYFNIKPDITVLGKIIGGGLPVGAFGGKNRIMKLLAPEGGVYQAGTFSGNPLTTIAGLVTLKILKEENPYSRLEEMTLELIENIKNFAQEKGIKFKINHLGSMFSIFFTEKDVFDYATARTQNTYLFKKFYQGLLNKGVYLSPSGFEANFLSLAHKKEDIIKTVEAFKFVFKNFK